MNVLTNEELIAQTALVQQFLIDNNASDDIMLAFSGIVVVPPDGGGLKCEEGCTCDKCTEEPEEHPEGCRCDECVGTGN